MTEIHNPRSNDSIDQYYLRLDCTNDPLTAGLDIAPDTDVISTFGRWKAGYESTCGADGAVLAHFDMFNNTDFALAQDNAGDTYLNSGRYTYFGADGTVFGRIYESGGVDIFHLVTDVTLALGGSLGSERVEITQSGTDPTILDIDTDYSNLLLNVNGSINADATITGLTIVGANVTSGADPGHTHTGASLSGIDISADTNLAASTGITLTDDTLTTNDSEIVHQNLSGAGTNTHAEIDTFIGTTVPNTYLKLDTSNDPITDALHFTSDTEYIDQEEW